MILPKILLAFNLCSSRYKEIFPPKYSYDSGRKLKLIDRSNYKVDNNKAKGFNIPCPKLINSIPQSPFIATIQQEVAKTGHCPFPHKTVEWTLTVGNCNREEQIWLHIRPASFILTFVFYCFCYKFITKEMLPIA